MQEKLRVDKYTRFTHSLPGYFSTSYLMNVLCNMMAHSRNVFTSAGNLKPETNSLEGKAFMATNNAGNKKHT